METPEAIQTAFLKKINAYVGAGHLLSNEIADLLHISRSEAYNKISGKSALTIAQVQVLCKKYNVNFEIGKPHHRSEVRVSYTPFHTGKISVSDYLASLNQFMKRLKKEQLIKLVCATDDIPFFHLFKYPELTAFKLFFWESRIPGKKNGFTTAAFDFKKIRKSNIKLAYRLHTSYLALPSTEIWTKSQLLITFDQLKNAYESHLLKDRSMALLICDQLLQTLDDVEQYAVQGNKGTTSALFDWYECDVVGNVAYLAETAHSKISFLRFNTFNNFTSEDAGLYQEVNTWLQFVMMNATGFTGHGSKQRNDYLQKSRNSVVRLREKFASG